jgi:hypothetical protein
LLLLPEEAQQQLGMAVLEAVVVDNILIGLVNLQLQQVDMDILYQYLDQDNQAEQVDSQAELEDNQAVLEDMEGLARDIPHSEEDIGHFP